MGISKKALLEDFYLDEIGEIAFELSDMKYGDESEETVYADEFFGF